jgi:predicted dehydrogenase
MLNVGVLGAGAIAPPYYMAMNAWPQLRLVACASKNGASARTIAAQYGIEALGTDELIADPRIDVVVNLTPPQAHYETSKAILAAGKHLYSEKPLTTRFQDAKELVDLANAKGLRIGCAPDTFLGSAHQEARAALDEGAIGKPIGGALFLGGRGCEAWHPHPEPYYAAGGGPPSDQGPYYLTQLVNLLGPVASVSAVSASPVPTRVLGNRSRIGETIKSEVDTTVVALLQMASGPLVTLAMSWDMGSHGRVPIEIYGSEGSLQNPDPNWSDGPVRLVRDGATAERDHSGRCFFRPTMITFQGNAVGYYRLSGLADMADAIVTGRPHRASGELALHVLEIIEAIRTSGSERRQVELTSTCERPEPVTDDISHAADIKPFGEELLDSRTLF